MPGDLREKIKLWELLNKILKNNGYIDADAIASDLANLKEKLNTLLSEVLGVEHEIDGIHNYDDTTLKAQLVDLTTRTTTKLNAIQADIDSLTARLSSINSTSTTFEVMKNDNSLKLSPSHIDVIQQDGVIKVTSSYLDLKGSFYQMTADQTSLIVNAGPTLLGSIIVGGTSADAEHPNGSAGVDIETDNKIHLVHRTRSHFVKIDDDQISISDINGLIIEPDGTTGIIIRNLAKTKTIHIAWE